MTLSPVEIERIPDPNVSQMLGPLDEPGFTFTPTGLTIEIWVTEDAWVKYGRKLQLAEKGIQWALGDWIIFGEARFKDRAEQAVEFSGLKIKTLQNYAVVASAVGKSRRRDSDVVDFSTHAEVASLPDEEQEKILAMAEGDPSSFTRKEVRREVHKAKRRMGKIKSEIEVLQEPGVREFLGMYADTVKDWESHVPSNASFLRSMLQSHIGQVQWQLDRTVDSDCATIMLAFDEWDRATDSDIYNWLQARGYFMRDPELDERLEHMACIGSAEKREDNCLRDCKKHSRMLLTVSIEDSRQEGRRGGMGELYQVHPAYLAKN